MTDWKHIQEWKRRHVDTMAKINWNKVPIHQNSTEDTWDATFHVCKAARKNGYLFACEVKMRNGRRADVIIPEANMVVEIYDTESQESLDAKQEDYGYLMVRVDAHDWAIDLF